MDMKTLDISGEKKNLAAEALEEAAQGMAPDMARIYGITRKQALDGAKHKLVLTAAQKNVMISALSLWLKRKPHDPRSETAARMLDQLELTKKQYREKYSR